MPSKTPKDFEEAWRKYVNGSDDTADDDLRTCLRVATTLDQMCQVFNASFTGRYPSNGVRSPALKKMLSIVRSAEEAKRVYSFASQSGPRGYFFPARQKEAKAKLDSFRASA